MNVTDWRAAHSWLRGYSDALRGALWPTTAKASYDPAAYWRGARVGWDTARPLAMSA